MNRVEIIFDDDDDDFEVFQPLDHKPSHTLRDLSNTIVPPLSNNELSDYISPSYFQDNNTFSQPKLISQSSIDPITLEQEEHVDSLLEMVGIGDSKEITNLSKRSSLPPLPPLSFSVPQLKSVHEKELITPVSLSSCTSSQDDFLTPPSTQSVQNPPKSKPTINIKPQPVLKKTPTIIILDEELEKAPKLERRNSLSKAKPGFGNFLLDSDHSSSTANQKALQRQNSAWKAERNKKIKAKHLLDEMIVLLDKQFLDTNPFAREFTSGLSKAKAQNIFVDQCCSIPFCIRLFRMKDPQAKLQHSKLLVSKSGNTRRIQTNLDLLYDDQKLVFLILDANQLFLQLYQNGPKPYIETMPIIPPDPRYDSVFRDFQKSTFCQKTCKNLRKTFSQSTHRIIFIVYGVEKLCHSLHKDYVKSKIPSYPLNIHAFDSIFTWLLLQFEISTFQVYDAEIAASRCVNFLLQSSYAPYQLRRDTFLTTRKSTESQFSVNKILPSEKLLYKLGISKESITQYIKMLLQVPGISLEKVSAIIQHFPSLFDLYRYFQRSYNSERVISQINTLSTSQLNALLTQEEQFFSNIKFGTLQRKIGPSLTLQIVEYLFSSNPDSYINLRLHALDDRDYHGEEQLGPLGL